MDRTRRRDGRTDGRTDSAITICLPKFLWGHKKKIYDKVTEDIFDMSNERIFGEIEKIQKNRDV